MSLHITPDGRGGSCFLTCADIYRYGEFIFEFHPYLGPTLCRKDGEPSNRTLGPKSRFWPAFDEWSRLSDAEKEVTRWSPPSPSP